MKHAHPSLFLKILCTFLLGTMAATLPAAERIVSLAPNLTEMVYLLGGEAQLIGSCEACDYPDGARSLPRAGQLATPNLEAVAALRPTVLIAETLQHPHSPAQLEALGIRCILLPSRNFEDYFSNLETLGKLLGKEAQAAAHIAAGRARIAAWRQRNMTLSEKSGSRPMVLLAIGVNPIITAGGESFLSSLIELAGGENLAAGEKRSYFQVSFEWVLAHRPEVILAPGMGTPGLKELEKAPGWRAIPAVREQRVVTDFDGDLLYRLGPRTFDGVDLLYELFHPGREVDAIR